MPRRSKQQPKGLARGGVVQVEGQMIRRVKTVAFHADWIGRLGMTERGKRRAGGGKGNGGGGEGCGLGVYGYGYWILDMGIRVVGRMKPKLMTEKSEGER